MAGAWSTHQPKSMLVNAGQCRFSLFMVVCGAGSGGAAVAGGWVIRVRGCWSMQVNACQVMSWLEVVGLHIEDLFSEFLV